VTAGFVVGTVTANVPLQFNRFAGTSTEIRYYKPCRDPCIVLQDLHYVLDSGACTTTVLHGSELLDLPLDCSKLLSASLIVDGHRVNEARSVMHSFLYVHVEYAFACTQQEHLVHLNYAS
jgi:hypothetical protein